MSSHTDFSTIKLSPQLLREYGDAALKNASDLLEEALLLHTNGHRARAYFLAVAAIEETGKALLAFDAQGRNLLDPAVTTKLKKTMEDHPSKIRAAFTGWLAASSNLRETVMSMVDLMIHLHRGREPSMYTDIRSDTNTVQVPANVVRVEAARDCIRLATDCLAHARRHIVETSPLQRTRAEDQLFAMKSTEYQKIANTEDFWWYYIAQLESGQKDFAEAVVQYRSEFFLKGKQFKCASEEARGT